MLACAQVHFFRFSKKVVKDERERVLAKKSTTTDQESLEYLSLPLGEDSFLASLDFTKQPRTEKSYRTIVEPTLSACRPDIFWGSISEKTTNIMEKYLQNPPASVVQQAAQSTKKVPDIITDMIRYKFMRSLCVPGEAVGALAAQSIGEPSTQMTLNTFHFAGRGEMNVTLGIPRLREILMTASRNIKTPTMEVPVLEKKEHEAEQLRVRMNKVVFGEVVEYFEVTTTMAVGHDDQVSSVLEMYMQLLPKVDIEKKTCLSRGQILKQFERNVVKKLLDAIKVKMSIKSMVKGGRSVKVDSSSNEAEEVDERGRVVNTEDEDADEIKSDDEAADPEAAKSRDTGAEYAGDVDDADIAKHLGYAGEEDEEDEDEENDEVSEKNKENADESVGGAPVFRKDVNVGKRKCDPMRIENVKGLDDWIITYKYDAKDDGWCRLTFAIPVTDQVVDPQSVIETELKKTILYSIPNIKRSFLQRDKEKLVLKTEGVNFDYLMKFDRVLEMHRLFSNDIQAVAGRFGIEAAMQTIIRECKTVFGAYGIEVNHRHLSLVADYMCVDGTVRAFNRIALANSASPFQKMSFETSMNFYKDAVISGSHDFIKSPSAQLVVGKNVSVGTGLFSLRQGIL